MERVLIIGSLGQIGSELVIALRKKYGAENVFATDIKNPGNKLRKSGPFQILDAVKNKSYECFLSEDTALPMMFMEDAIQNTIRLMEVEGDKLSLRSSYNMAGISFTPKELAESIQKRIPEFRITYNPDFRQVIAESWPASIDDSVAQRDWGLNVNYDLEKMVDVMLKEVSKKLKG